MKVKVARLKDELVDESNSRYSAEELQQKLESMQQIRRVIKRENRVGRGGAKRWPVHVVLLICELLVNGSPPSAVPKIMQTHSAYFTGAEAEELPTVGFVQKTRTVVENINLVFAGMRLGNASSWQQLFTDGTSRQQIAFQNLLIRIMDDGEFDSVISSSCVYLENESAEKQVEAVKSKVSQCDRVSILLIAENL